MILIIEGADCSGKSTLVQQLMLYKSNKVFIHFPIYSSNDCSASIASNVSYCAPISKTDSIKTIQDIMLANIEANSQLILDLHNSGADVILDRYVYSNIVYRKLLGAEQPSNFADVVKNVCKIAQVTILTPADEVLITRKRNRTNDSSEVIDDYTEKDYALFAANNIYKAIRDANNFDVFEVSKLVSRV